MTRGFLGVVGLLAAAGAARADVVYEFASATGTPTSSFVASEGGTLTVRVYVRDTSAGAAVFNANGGLATARFRLFYDNPSGRVDVANAASVVPATVFDGGPWADNEATIVGSTTVRVGVLSRQTAGVLPDANGRIWLATVTLRALTQGTTTLRLADPDANRSGDTTSFATNGAGNPLVEYDALLSQTNVTVLVTVVPEPAGLLVAAAGAVWVSRRTRRAVRGTATAPPAAS